MRLQSRRDKGDFGRTSTRCVGGDMKTKASATTTSFVPLPRLVGPTASLLVRRDGRAVDVTYKDVNLDTLA